MGIHRPGCHGITMLVFASFNVLFRCRNVRKKMTSLFEQMYADEINYEGTGITSNNLIDMLLQNLY